TSFSVGGKGYVGTGYSFPARLYLDDFWEYNPVSDDWRQIADYLGGERGGASSFSIDDRGYVGSGFGNVANSLLLLIFMSTASLLEFGYVEQIFLRWVRGCTL